MTVSYAQFIVQFPEFAAIEQTMVDPLLGLFDAHYDGFGNFHDDAIYVRTALELNASVFGQTMGDQSTEQNRYLERWERMLAISFRRGQISGGGLT